MQFILVSIITAVLGADTKASDGKHLFILSGQSNMAGLRPRESFTPSVQKEFGKANVIVVKDARGGQPIRRWYKKWKPKTGKGPKAKGDLYDRLMGKVKAAIKGKKIKSVTFIWMQGERDARERHDVYSASLQGLLDQLSADMKRKDINFVVGRLSDFDMQNRRYKHWTKIRKVQVAFAKAKPKKRAWVDTDDLNDGKSRRGKDIKNDLHYSAKGYVILGERFADKAIRLIKGKKP